MRTDAWSSDEEEEEGEEAEAGRLLRHRKQWGRKRYVEILNRLLDCFHGLFDDNGVA